MQIRMGVCLVGFLWVWTMMPLGAAAGRPGAVTQVKRACGWLGRALKEAPERSDAFGVVMRRLDAQCGLRLKALRDRSEVDQDTLAQLSLQIRHLQEGLEGETPGKNVPPEARGFEGLWVQDPVEEMGQNVRRSLDINVTEGEVQALLFEERWYDAPRAWVETSCGGHKVFKMLVSTDLAGVVDDDLMSLKVGQTRVLSCTCPSRCRVRNRTRGLRMALSDGGRTIKGSIGRFRRDGDGGGDVGEPDDAPPSDGETPGLNPAGRWVQAPGVRLGVVRERSLDVVVRGDRLEVILTLKTDRPLPLKKWSHRYCGGAERHVTTERFVGEGTWRDGEGAIRWKQADLVTCNCTRKCRKPTTGRGEVRVDMATDGRIMTVGGERYAREP